jgi:hypothetical protein
MGKQLDDYENDEDTLESLCARGDSKLILNYIQTKYLPGVGFISLTKTLTYIVENCSEDVVRVLAENGDNRVQAALIEIAITLRRASLLTMYIASMRKPTTHIHTYGSRKAMYTNVCLARNIEVLNVVYSAAFVELLDRVYYGVEDNEPGKIYMECRDIHQTSRVLRKLQMPSLIFVFLTQNTREWELMFFTTLYMENMELVRDFIRISSAMRINKDGYEVIEYIVALEVPHLLTWVVSTEFNAFMRRVYLRSDGDTRALVRNLEFFFLVASTKRRCMVQYLQFDLHPSEFENRPAIDVIQNVATARHVNAVFGEQILFGGQRLLDLMEQIYNKENTLTPQDKLMINYICGHRAYASQISTREVVRFLVRNDVPVALQTARDRIVNRYAPRFAHEMRGIELFDVHRELMARLESDRTIRDLHALQTAAIDICISRRNPEWLRRLLGIVYVSDMDASTATTLFVKALTMESDLIVDLLLNYLAPPDSVEYMDAVTDAYGHPDSIVTADMLNTLFYTNRNVIQDRAEYLGFNRSTSKNREIIRRECTVRSFNTYYAVDNSPMIHAINSGEPSRVACLLSMGFYIPSSAMEIPASLLPIVAIARGPWIPRHFLLVSGPDLRILIRAVCTARTVMARQKGPLFMDVRLWRHVMTFFSNRMCGPTRGSSALSPVTLQTLMAQWDRAIQFKRGSK